MQQTRRQFLRRSASAMAVAAAPVFARRALAEEKQNEPQLIGQPSGPKGKTIEIGRVEIGPVGAGKPLETFFEIPVSTLSDGKINAGLLKAGLAPGSKARVALIDLNHGTNEFGLQTLTGKVGLQVQKDVGPLVKGLGRLLGIGIDSKRTDVWLSVGKHSPFSMTVNQYVQMGPVWVHALYSRAYDENHYSIGVYVSF